MTRNRTIIAATILAALSSPTWAINKCTLADGKVTFQDAPCATGTGGSIEKKPKPDQEPKQVMSPSEVSKAFEAQFEKRRQDAAEYRSKPRWHRPAEQEIVIPTLSPGMTTAQVSGLWGNASSVNETVTAVGKSEQWVYPRGRYETQYVHFFKDRVTSVSTIKH